MVHRIGLRSSVKAVRGTLTVLRKNNVSYRMQLYWTLHRDSGISGRVRKADC